MSSRVSLPAHLLSCAGLLYLALPFLLFLSGWLRPAFSIPLCVALMYGLYVCARQLPTRRISFNKRGLAVLGALSIFCLLLVLLCGFTGHCQQHADFIIRNTIYEGLITHSWPLVTEDGSPLIYYLGYWLPPALVASFFPASWAPWLLALWTFLGLELSLLIVASRWGVRQTTYWATILLCLGTPTAALECLGVPLFSLTTEYNAQMVELIGMSTQLFNTFNHAIPALLCSVFLLTRSLPPAGYYFTGALLLPSSPVGALLLLPYIVYETLFRHSAPRKLLSRFQPLLTQPIFWIATLCVPIMAIFYAHLDGGGHFFCLFDARYGELYHYVQGHLLLYPDSVKYTSFLLALLLDVLLPGALLLPKLQKNPLYYITLVLMAGIIFFRVGIMNNELLLKAPAVLYPFLALLMLQAFRQGTLKYRIVLVLYLAISSLPSFYSITEKAGTFSTREDIMRENCYPADDLSFKHQDPLIRRQFMKKADHPLPTWLFKTGAPSSSSAEEINPG